MATTRFSPALDRFTTFGDLLKYLRRRAGLTQRELSIAVSYSDTQISRLEQNERLPDLATLTARFLPALHIEDEPDVVERLLELAAAVRREDAPAVGLSPYKGLHFFDEADAELFFGRETLTEQLLGRLFARLETDLRFLAVIGASGSGKSSVVRAGLLPSLRWQPRSSGWPLLILTPTAHPIEALAACLSREAPSRLPVRKIVENLIADPDMLSDCLTRMAQAAGAEYTVLIFDQFEELFTLCRSVEEQAAFVDSLMAAAGKPGGQALILIVLRADFYAHCARFNELRQAVSQHQEYIGPMSSVELRRAIEEPARHGHWDFEEGLVNLLLHDVGADVGHNPEPGALPLLSHALLATWQRRRGRMLTLSGYTASGGVRGAIAETAEAVFYDQLEPEQREIARQIFLRLTELGGDTSTADTRRRVNLAELVSRPDSRQMVQEVLLTLADARLITTDQDTAEVAHEALIREWPTLRGWLEEDREGLRLHRRLTEAAQEWEVAGRDASVLFRGARLAQAVEWTTAHAAEVNTLEREFVEASAALQEKENIEREAQMLRELEAARRLAETERAHAAEQAHTSRRLRQRALWLSVALVSAAMLAAAALWFWSGAAAANRLANSRELAAAAVNNLQVDPERSALLALEALNQADTLEARNALRQAVPALHLQRAVPAHEGGVPDVVTSPDGQLIVSMGALGEIKVWDAASAAELRTLDNPSGEVGGSLAFSPDGSLLAAGWGTQIVVWDTRSWQMVGQIQGQAVGTTVGYNLGVGQLCFSPDSRLLAAANLDGLPRVWDLAEFKEILALGVLPEPDQPPERSPQKAIACHPQGSLIATGGDEGLVWVWDATSGAQLFTLELGGIIHSVSYSPDGTRLVAASEDGSVRVWDARTTETMLNLPRLAGLYDVVFLADGRFATAGQDGVTRVWDAASGQEQLSLAGPNSTVIGVAGSPDGRRIYTGAYDGLLRVWDAAPGAELLTLPGHSAIVWNVAFSPDGSRFASASVDGFVRLWEAQTGELMLSLSDGTTSPDGFTGVAFSRDGNRLAGGSTSGKIVIWDSRSGAVLDVLRGHQNFVTGLAFSPDGTLLASASWDGTASVWDLTSGTQLSTFQGSPTPALITNITFSPDGRTVFSSGAEDRFIYQWEAATGQQVAEFASEGKEIYGLALSPDGSLLAGGNQDGEIVFWEVPGGEVVRIIPAHAGLLLRMAFSPDGTRLATAGFDKLAKVWDVTSGEELFSLFGNASNVFGVAFSPDGERVVSSGADGTLRVFTTSIAELVKLANSRLTRGLTETECQKFMHVAACP